MTRELDLEIGGMTCASCAARIEKQLNRMDGVEATVNYATEEARVRCVDPVTVDDLIAEVEAAGYTARSVHDDGPERHDGPDHDDPNVARRLAVSAVLAVPVVLMGMVPALQFNGWEWVSLVLATPVVLWGAYPFHRTAWAGARHGTATMDTLISIGVIAAYGWSLVGLATDDHVWFEVAAGVTVLILTGRFLEARAKRQAGAALRALLELGAKDVAVLRDGSEERIPIEDLAVGDRFVVRPGEQVATDGVVESGSSAVDAVAAHGRERSRRGRAGRRRDRRHRERRRPARRAGDPRRRRHRAGPHRPARP